MCVNDIVCSGAKPLFFLDYIALGKSVAEKVADIVSGVAEGCVQAGCALIGGETAEMPGFYRDGEYDVAGFAVGLADRSRMPDKTRVRAGDTIVGLPSSGLHSNGYSLVRSVLDVERADLLSPVAELGGCSLGDALLAPTRIYVKPILALLQKVDIHSIAHITGGGFYENIPRSLPSGAGARIERKTFDVPQIFEMIQRIGDIPQRDMFNTFNMGIGMTVVVRPDQADEAVRILRKEGVEAVCIGEVAEGDGGVELC
jgi:phosphoribosylformylglycinamidine cyclo-ligase